MHSVYAWIEMTSRKNCWVTHPTLRNHPLRGLEAKRQSVSVCSPSRKCCSCCARVRRLFDTFSRLCPQIFLVLHSPAATARLPHTRTNLTKNPFLSRPQRSTRRSPWHCQLLVAALFSAVPPARQQGKASSPAAASTPTPPQGTAWPQHKPCSRGAASTWRWPTRCTKVGVW